jgi:hypothetical protein
LARMKSTVVAAWTPAWARGVRCVRRRAVGRAAWSARHHLCARGTWRKERGPGRRFSMGGPTAHGPADGSRSRRPGLESPLAWVTRDAGATVRSGTPRGKTVQTGLL